MSILNGFIVVILISAVTALGDFFMKLAGNSNEYMNIKWFTYGILLYLITGFGWFIAMKTIKISSIGAIYGITTVILLALMGVLFFNEKLNTIEVIAIIMGVASICLLLRFN